MSDLKEMTRRERRKLSQERGIVEGSARAVASPRDIVGLIWRSGINQRANILRGCGNAAGAVFLSAT